jgi:hypothetical protein
MPINDITFYTSKIWMAWLRTAIARDFLKDEEFKALPGKEKEKAIDKIVRMSLVEQDKLSKELVNMYMSEGNRSLVGIGSGLQTHDFDEIIGILMHEEVFHSTYEEERKNAGIVFDVFRDWGWQTLPRKSMATTYCGIDPATLEQLDSVVFRVKTNHFYRKYLKAKKKATVQFI